MITVDQVKAARKLLGWSQMTLALEANVEHRLSRNSRERKAERKSERFPQSKGPLRPPVSSSRMGNPLASGLRLAPKIESALPRITFEAGVIFVAGPGVRLKNSDAA
jgi:hypothetical protein